MRTILSSFCVLLVATLVTFADDAKKDAEKIKGTWLVVSVERNGDKLPEEVTREWKLVITADKLTAKVSEGDHDVNYVLDPAKKPKHVDLTPRDGDKKDKVLKAIYELEGDQLKLCVADDENAERPTEFKSPAGSTLIVLTLKREK